MTGEIVAVSLFVLAVIVIAVIGLRVGMLVAPRIDRLSDGDDQVDRADPD